MHWATSLHRPQAFLFLRKKKRVCECIKSLTFKSHNFVIIGVCLRFVLIENGKLYFKPHNLWMDLNQAKMQN